MSASHHADFCDCCELHVDSCRCEPCTVCGVMLDEYYVEAMSDLCLECQARAKNEETDSDRFVGAVLG